MTNYVSLNFFTNTNIKESDIINAIKSICVINDDNPIYIEIDSVLVEGIIKTTRRKGDWNGK